MANDVPALILAGGRSSRMGGGDKTLRHLAGRPLLAHVAGRLAPQAGALALSANGDPARFSDFGLAVLADTISGFPGPLAGILAGMVWVAEDPSSDHLVTVAGDTPFLPLDLVDRLFAAKKERPDAIAVAASGGRTHPVFALWPLALAGTLRDFLTSGRSLKVMDFISACPHAVTDFPLIRTGGGLMDPFFNVNTPGDLAEAERLEPELSL